MKDAIKISGHKLYQSAGLVDDGLISGSMDRFSTS